MIHRVVVLFEEIKESLGQIVRVMMAKQELTTSYKNLTGCFSVTGIVAAMKGQAKIVKEKYNEIIQGVVNSRDSYTNSISALNTQEL